MRFRNSLRLLMENFKHVYKLFIAKAIISIVTIALCSAFVLPEVMSLWNSKAVRGLVENGKEFFSNVFIADAATMEPIKEAIFGKGGSLSQVAALLSSKTLEIVLTIAGCILVYLIKRFADTVCHFTTGSLLNDKMASYAETKYSTAFVTNLGKASAYAAAYVPIVFLFDVITLALVWGILSICPILVGMFVGMTAIVIMQAFKFTVTGSWLPAMTTDGKKLRQAMKGSLKAEKRQGIKIFAAYLVSVYMIIIFNVMAAICTFGSALLVTLPASYVFLICMQYVNYYTVHGKKYFLTYEQIEKNADHGDSEHFFEYINEEEQNHQEQK